MFTINQDGTRNFLHPADVHGRFQARKNVVYSILLLVYVLVPWITIGGHPAVHVDLPGRTAYLFGRSFTNQDAYLLFFLVSGLGFALFVVTSLWGRIWCGYACPQTVFLEGVFRRIERWIEGPRDTRIRRNLGPLTTDKVWRKGAKHVVFLVLAYLTAHAFLAYFFTPRGLLDAVAGPPNAHMAAFLWGVAWTAILYFDFAWFREQTCLVICPYGRAQSALIDADTLVIGYDERRGEPRSKKTAEGGDCIDCFRCVAVCPTGIDIRNGLQMECIGCANCVDACDEIMDRIERPRGLIRYDSHRGFEGEPRRGLLRMRVLGYAVLGLLGLTVLGFSLAERSSFELHFLRAKGLPYRLEGDVIRNVLTIRVQNKSEEAAVYFVDAAAPGHPDATFVVSQVRLEVPGLADVTTPVIVTVPEASFDGPFPLSITVSDSTSGSSRTIDASFRGPIR
jgi:cytochrome c oxidase accessory protein FixG